MPAIPSLPRPLLLQVFDLVAPIAIYHGADVLFRQEAAAACRKLKTLHAVQPQVAAALGGVPEGFDWRQSVLEFGECPSGMDVRTLYDELLRQLVALEAPDWVAAFDRGGCRCFEVDGVRIDALQGDSPGHFAWYANAHLVLRRVSEELGLVSA